MPLPPIVEAGLAALARAAKPYAVRAVGAGAAQLLTDVHEKAQEITAVIGERRDAVVGGVMAAKPKRQRRVKLRAKKVPDRVVEAELIDDEEEGKSDA